MVLPGPDVPFSKGTLLTVDAQERRGQEQPTRGFTNLTRGAAAGFLVPAVHPHYAFPCTKILLKLLGTVGPGKN